MAMTAAQICQQAALIAGSPGFAQVATGATTSPAGLALNQILQDLAQGNDLDVTRGYSTFNFNTGLVSSNAFLIAGSGPYSLPSDFLRCDKGDIEWWLNGVPYPMVPIDLVEFDRQVQTAGIQSYPYWFATDMSTSPPSAYVYPAPSGNYPVQLRYKRQMPDIANPETSSTTPWFPNQQYLVVKTAAEIMRMTDDERCTTYLVEAERILSKYLQLADDRSDRSQKIQLDRRTFGRRFSTLKNTKVVGW